MVEPPSATKQHDDDAMSYHCCLICNQTTATVACTLTVAYTLRATKQHDDEAMSYLGCLIYPIVLGYAAYSLAYDEHKSWYSFLLRATVG